MEASSAGAERLERVLAAIDEANAADPHTIVVGGAVRPKDQAHAEMMTRWVRELAPDCSEEQLIAARAHHLRRWAIPRDAYPRDRGGYLRWRTALRRQHAEDVAAIMRDGGYGDESVARVQAIDGVESVTPMVFRRQGQPDPAPLESGVLPIGRLEIARLANDRNFPERGKLTIRMGGGK